MNRFATLFATLSLGLLPLGAMAGDRTIDFQGDPKMSRAISDARESLPRFLAKVMDNQGNSAAGSMLKAAIPRNNAPGTEVIWVGSIRRTKPGHFRGKLENEPNDLGGLHLGSTVTFDQGQIYDWGYMDKASNRLFGHYTTRVIAKRLNTSERRRIEAMFAKPPLPRGW